MSGWQESTESGSVRMRRDLGEAGHEEIYMDGGEFTYQRYDREAGLLMRDVVSPYEVERMLKGALDASGLREWLERKLKREKAKVRDDMRKALAALEALPEGSAINSATLLEILDEAFGYHYPAEIEATLKLLSGNPSCPACGEDAIGAETIFRCAKGHHFDSAGEREEHEEAVEILKVAFLAVAKEQGIEIDKDLNL